jgi:hypothetical protein
VILLEVQTKGSTEPGFAEDDHTLEAFASYRGDDTFHVSLVTRVTEASDQMGRPPKVLSAPERLLEASRGHRQLKQSGSHGVMDCVRNDGAHCDN